MPITTPSHSSARPTSAAAHRRATGVVGLATALLAALALGGCQPRLTIAALEQQEARPLADFARWWTSEQAELLHVDRPTIARWVRDADARLDGPASRSGRWDLSTDLCSFAPDAGTSFDFRWPCIRHDLAWRNLKRLDRQRGGGVDTPTRRRQANERFLADLRSSCASRAHIELPQCLATAAAYVRAVDLAT